ncbi:MAG: hypothetical protein QM817_07465 [Archangium sp.]
MNHGLLIRVVAIGVAVIGALGWLMFNGLFGKSQLVVLRSGATLHAALDDEAAIDQTSDDLVFEVRPGTHHVTFGSGKKTIKVKGGGERWVVPAPGQCFVVVDATRLFQHSTVFAQARNSPALARTFRATIDDRWVDGEPHKLGKGYWFSTPASVKGGAVKVVKALECSELGVPDSELLERLGFAD